MVDLWFPEDVKRILASLAASGAERGYEYLLALYHVALAFGLVEQERETEPPEWEEYDP